MLWKPFGPKTNLEVEEMMKKTRNRFAQLPPIFAKVLTLHCFNELDPEEIADQLPPSRNGKKRSTTNVSVLLWRGREMLAEKFGRGPAFFKTKETIDGSLGK
jgi:DNA-directed RNA polymerase specialized sigma24 family protein